MVSSVPIARPCALALLVRVQCRVSRPRLAMCLVVENYAASSLLVYCAVHIYIFVCARHTGQSTPGEAACAAGAKGCFRSPFQAHLGSQVVMG